MNKNAPTIHAPPLGGFVEPHAHLLKTPLDGQLLYKIISVEHLLSSIAGNYLHFNRVDCYTDLPNADPHDGQQLPSDRQGNARASFKNAPDFSAGNYYDQSRARTYACCFSLENSKYIWDNYGNGGANGKVCVVFEFGKLRATLNETLQPGNAAIEYEGKRCHQIFSVNYGIIQYVEWNTHQANTAHLPNPIEYTYFKAKSLDEKDFYKEAELRIALSALGVWQFVLKDGNTMQFPSSLQLAFNFRSAFTNHTIHKILCAPDVRSDHLQAELHKLRIVNKKGVRNHLQIKAASKPPNK